jgi:hypothetical protein
MRALALFFVLSLPSVGLSQKSEPLNQLDIPKISEFGEQRFDVSKQEILKWIDDILTVLSTEKFDYSVRSVFDHHSKDDDGHVRIITLTHQFRQAKNPETKAARLISVRRRSTEKPVVMTNLGILRDTRSHTDILRKGEKCEVCHIVAFETSISEQLGEADWDDLIAEVELLAVFDPCTASAVSSKQTSGGHALDFSHHNFRDHAIRSVIQQGEYVHVLLRFKGGDQRCQIATFHERVPVQVCGLEWTGSDEANAKVDYVTRSQWLAPKGSEQKLPIRIQGQCDVDGLPCELNATIEWKLGNDVDLSMFDRTTLGVQRPVPKSDFRIPLLHR